MNRCAVKRIAALQNANKADALLVRLGPERGTFSAACGHELPVFLAELDNVLGSCGIDACHVGEQRWRSGIHVDADMVNRRFDDAAQRLLQPLLTNIMLILSDADRFGLDLDKLGQRVLQAVGRWIPRCAPQHPVPGIPPAASLDAEYTLAPASLTIIYFSSLAPIAGCFAFADKVRDELLRLPGSRAVADDDQFDFVTVDQAR